MTKKIITSIFLALLLFYPIFGQENDETEDDYAGITSYGVGDQLFSLNAGAIIPLFNLAPFSTADEASFTSLSSLKTGLAGSIKWGAFIRDNLSLGAELCGMFASTDNRSLTMIPISFVTTYYFINYPFEFPLSVNAGFSLNTLDDYFKITPIIKPGFGAYWNFNIDWAFGINIDYWIVPEIYFSDEFAGESRIANFLQINLSGVYHF